MAVVIFALGPDCMIAVSEDQVKGGGGLSGLNSINPAHLHLVRVDSSPLVWLECVWGLTIPSRILKLPGVIIKGNGRVC